MDPNSSAAAPARRGFRERCRPIFSWLPVAGLIPSFLLAVWSLTQPWVRGRALLVVGISRSPGAAILLAVTLAGMVGASVAVGTKGRRPVLAGVVHAATALVMVVVALIAYGMIKRTKICLLKLIPLGSVHPAIGLHTFLIASLLLLGVGSAEALTGLRKSRQSHP